jgi:hypothetical protein
MAHHARDDETGRSIDLGRVAEGYCPIGHQLTVNGYCVTCRVGWTIRNERVCLTLHTTWPDNADCAMTFEWDFPASTVALEPEVRHG